MSQTAKLDPRVERGMEALFDLRRAQLSAHGRPLGWKAGFGAPAAMAKLGIDRPLVGFLMREAKIESGSTVSVAGWKAPVAEPEVAIHMGADLRAGATTDEVKAAIAGVGPAIELADLNPVTEDIETILRCDIYHRHVVLGPCDTRRAGGRVGGLTGRMFRRGEEAAATTEIEANTGRLTDITAHIANVLGHFGEWIHEGEVIIAGSVVPPVFLDPDDDEFTWRLEPIGEISVRFDHG